MAWVVPDDLEDAVRVAARAALGDAPLATRALTAAIVDRSRRYTSERDRLSADRTGDLAARAVFFTIADAMKIAIPLGELAHRGALPAARPIRLLDLGAGCGAMSLGAIVALSALAGSSAADLALDIVAIDCDGPALAIAHAALRDLAARRGLPVTIATRDEDVTRARLPPADLIVLGTVLNELPAAARLELVHRALAAIGDDGAVIVVEPALRDTARALHELRDTILAGGGHVFAPCTRTGAPCPALTDPSDWCHEDRPLTLPRRTAELARLTHLRDGGMKFAYLVLRRRPLGLVELRSRAGAAWRVVSAPMPAKGKLELIGCSEAGRIPIRLLRRHRAPHNRGFESAVRGDVLVVGPPSDAASDATPNAAPNTAADTAPGTAADTAPGTAADTVPGTAAPPAEPADPVRVEITSATRVERLTPAEPPRPRG
ncbi:MAG TPA: small ribosomal subunit Rsm22 family protein [Kofleriaceae bacterium]|nr:small ribosomal subunit Rsm22 family protein [Kofleriaceae bacterium]